MEISKFEKAMQDKMALQGWSREDLEVIVTLSSFRKSVFRKLTEHGFIKTSYKEFLTMINKLGIAETLESLERAYIKKENDYKEFRMNYFNSKKEVF